ncbi:DNA internalization-related competence protein ComEC/Rec2 [Tahibacter amnicola]|uniref:DNA internalization-related competence protein ComEC/Rec2 n=1 Tax=Tahibacter amnicola TaxID=2976241 RepID=A0ABY6BM60_9GAMM|nr:DNA internalization-related competence protein ComEC/Rec2 [Tahibacter amnicola]UXI70711.1 DNA internalization-related competence protein ComEC/Rec2 [Tahibacter amnicola]
MDGQNPTHRFPGLALTPSAALALLAGVVLVQALPVLPPMVLSIGLLVASVCGLLRWPRQYAWLLVLVGAAWACCRADLALHARLAPVLEGQDLLVTGRVVDLPDRRADALRFDLRIDTAASEGQPVPLSGRIRLSWHGSPPEVTPGAYWQLVVRLRPPRGLRNPGGFDFERYALQAGIVATGYVRESADNRFLAAPGRFAIDAWRDHIARHIDRSLGGEPHSRWLRALAVGDQRALTDADWTVLRATGTSHLMAISGFHVGLLAGFGVLLARAVWWCFPALLQRAPARHWEAPAAVAFAALYTALAGFGLPTLRTLIMIAVIAGARWVRRSSSSAQTLAVAATVILVIDPVAVLSAGFWLSFLGVAWLMFCLGERRQPWWREIVLAQAVTSLGLLPLGVWFFGQSSLIGPLANLVAVPWISFVVVPLTLAGVAMAQVAPVAGDAVLRVAALAMDLQCALLQGMATLPAAQWHFAEPSVLALLLAMAGAAWLLLPRGWPMKWVGLLLLLPLLWPRSDRPGPGEVDVEVLDVGQGLAVLVTTSNYAMVYDAGARYPSGFEMGGAAVVPAAHARGVHSLDLLVVSHADNDHAGGAPAVAAGLAPRRIEGGQVLADLPGAVHCEAGREWTWNTVQFRTLHGGSGDPLLSDNDRSCVILIQAAGGRVLLTGDITRPVEQRLVPVLRDDPVSPLALVVPHHGSKTSSSPAFLDAAQPVLGIVSAGYHNRFGHPHPDVVSRFVSRGAALLNTAESGCIRLRIGADGLHVREQCRLDRPRYWSPIQANFHR